MHRKLLAVFTVPATVILAILILPNEYQTTAHAQPNSFAPPTPTSIRKATATATPKVPTSTTSRLPPRPADNIVVNDDFESPIANWDMNLYSAGQTFDGWTVESGDIQLIAPGRWQNASGNQSVDLNGSTTGAILQDLLTSFHPKTLTS